MNDFDVIEEKLKKEEAEKKKSKQKVSGRSVFQLQKIIKEKAKKDGDDHSEGSVDGDE